MPVPHGRAKDLGFDVLRSITLKLTKEPRSSGTHDGQRVASARFGSSLPCSSHLLCRVECAWSLGAAQFQCSPLDPAQTGSIRSSSAGARTTGPKRQLERKNETTVESEKHFEKEILN